MTQPDTSVRDPHDANRREVLRLLQAAEDIADGLCRLTDFLYDLDPRTKEALKGANVALSQIADVRQEWEHGS